MESNIQQLTNRLLQSVEANIFKGTHGQKELLHRILRGPMLDWFRMLEVDHWTQSMVILESQIAITRMHECFEAHNYQYSNLRSRIKQLIQECMPRFRLLGSALVASAYTLPKSTSVSNVTSPIKRYAVRQ